MDRKQLYWILQLGGWTFYGVINLFLALPINFSWQAGVGVVLFSFFGFLCTQVYRNYIKSKEWSRLPLLKLFLRVVGASLLMTVVILIAMKGIGTLIPDPENQVEIPGVDPEAIKWLSFAIVLVNGTSVFILWSLIYFGIHIFWQYNEANVDKWRLEANLKASKLRELEYQLNPHFLFNSLSSIRALIHEDPPKAQSMLTHLSNLLRKTLKGGEGLIHTINEEVNLVRAYLELEGLRLEERLQVKWDIDESLLDATVPSLLVQTLVENSIKHGISTLPQGGEISISMQSGAPGTIEFIIINDGELTENPGNEGIGIKNIKERLSLLHGEKASFKLNQLEGPRVQARVVFPELFGSETPVRFPASSDYHESSIE